MTRNAGGLRALAKDLNVCVILLAQLNRSPDKREDKRPILSDIRECGALEQDAHAILAPHRPSYYNRDHPTREAELLVLANRNGPSGRINVRWFPQLMKFSPISNYR